MRPWGAPLARACLLHPRPQRRRKPGHASAIQVASEGRQLMAMLAEPAHAAADDLGRFGSADTALFRHFSAIFVSLLAGRRAEAYGRAGLQRAALGDER